MIDRTAMYGCVALRALGERIADGLVPIAELSVRTRIPKPYLAKVCQALERAGFLQTRRGVGGGVQLTRTGAEATAYQVTSALSDISGWRVCLFGHDPASCDHQGCQIWHGVVDQVEEVLSVTQLTSAAARQAVQAVGISGHGDEACTSE